MSKYHLSLPLIDIWTDCFTRNVEKITILEEAFCINIGKARFTKARVKLLIKRIAVWRQYNSLHNA